MKGFLVFALAIVAASASGQTITGYSGTLDNGSSVTIVGSGFGTKVPAAPYLFDDLRSSGYSALNDGDDIPTQNDDGCSECPMIQTGIYGGGVQIEKTPGNLRVSGESLYTATRKGLFLPAVDMRTHGATYNSKKTYLWFWYKANKSLYSQGIDADGDGDTDASATKIARVWSDNNRGDSGRTSEDWHIMMVRKGHTGCDYYAPGATSNNSTFVHSAGGWSNNELFFDVSPVPNLAVGADAAIVQWKVNGTMRHNRSDAWACAPFHVLRVLGADSSTPLALASDTQAWWGDLYIDITYARVMIGDNADFASCVHKEIFIPSAWSSTSITAEVNTGSFASDELVYLFVIDEDNNASAGFPVVIGASGGGLEPVALTAPTNLQVNGGN